MKPWSPSKKWKKGLEVALKILVRLLELLAEFG